MRTVLSFFLLELRKPRLWVVRGAPSDPAPRQAPSGQDLCPSRCYAVILTRGSSCIQTEVRPQTAQLDAGKQVRRAATAPGGVTRTESRGRQTKAPQRRPRPVPTPWERVTPTWRRGWGVGVSGCDNRGSRGREARVSGNLHGKTLPATPSLWQERGRVAHLGLLTCASARRRVCGGSIAGRQESRVHTQRDRDWMGHG